MAAVGEPDVVVLSPHQDDAAFSLGIMLSRLAAAGRRVRVLNCFTHSAYAPYGADGDMARVTAERAAEDRACYAAIHHSIEVVDLGLLDAPLRLDCAPGSVCAPRGVETADREAVNRIESALPAGGALLLPLAFDAHIDHRLALLAGLRASACARGFYEDLPYAAWVGEAGVMAAVGRIETQLGITLHPHMVAGDGDRKRAWIGAYRSQATAAELDAIAGYTRAKQGERPWLPVPLAAEWNQLLRF